MKFSMLLTILLAYCFCSIECTNYLPTFVNTIDVEKPAFVTLIPNDLNNKYHIAISSFNEIPFSNDYIFYIANYSMKSTSDVKQLDNTKLVWPNE